MGLKTYKYRLSPTKKQIELFQWTLDRNRELYNAALQEQHDAWNVYKQHPSFCQVPLPKGAGLPLVEFYERSMKLEQYQVILSPYFHATIIYPILVIKETVDNCI